MRSANSFDVAVVGGGIVGLATALELASGARRRLVLLEAEKQLAVHQTGHNSGVIHSGLYYRPGSSKARNCTLGRQALLRFCAENGVAHEVCGKVVIAPSDELRPRLDELERRGRANGLEGLERLDARALERHEPCARAVDGLYVPQAGIVDYRSVAAAMARRIEERGGEIRRGARVAQVERRGDGFVLRYSGGEAEAAGLINCAGLQSDRVARLCGVRPGVRIVPFRGEYYRLVPAAERLVRNLIYPVPDPRLPFLGVHFTRLVNGGIEAGPNAVLAWSRAGYSRGSFTARDAFSILSYPGFWRLAVRFWKTGMDETRRSRSKVGFVRALRSLVPEVSEADVVPGGAGVRAQAVAPDGSLVDDFSIVEAERMLHVLNAPSPAATASLAIGRHLAERAAEVLRLA